jgi:4-amino-4-deoxy-L-arabinose transferase-like glycosyltransferase
MRRFWILVLLTLMAFGLRAGSLTAQSLWRDEVDALCYAHEFPHLLWEALAPERAGDLQTPCACPPPPLPTDWTAGTLRERVVGLLGAMIRQNGPLYYFLLRGWVALAGHTEYAMRFFSLLFGVLCVPLTAALGTRLLGRTAATFAAALMAASPYMVWYGQEVKMYTLVPALVLLALYGLRRGMDEGGKWWAVQVIPTTLLLYTHIWGALLIPLQMLWLLVEWPRWRPRWRGALVGMALLTLPYLPLALWQAPAALVRRETGFPHHTLGEMALILLNGWSTGILSRGWPWGALACGGMAILGLVFGLARPASVGAGLAPAPRGQPQGGGQPQGVAPTGACPTFPGLLADAPSADRLAHLPAPAALHRPLPDLGRASLLSAGRSWLGGLKKNHEDTKTQKNKFSLCVFVSLWYYLLYLCPEPARAGHRSH